MDVGGSASSGRGELSVVEVGEVYVVGVVGREAEGDSPSARWDDEDLLESWRLLEWVKVDA